MKVAILLALSCVLPTEHARADQVPTQLVPFLRYVIQNRAEQGLKAVVTDRPNSKFGTVCGEP